MSPCKGALSRGVAVFSFALRCAASSLRSRSKSILQVGPSVAVAVSLLMLTGCAHEWWQVPRAVSTEQTSKQSRRLVKRSQKPATKMTEGRSVKEHKRIALVTDRNSPVARYAPPRAASRSVRVAREDVAATVRVYFGSDRNRTGSAKVEEFYGHGRATMSYGYSDVTIPHDHRMGILRRLRCGSSSSPPTLPSM
jgi:hypothetical protein